MVYELGLSFPNILKIYIANWPDYVFGKGYELMPLEEVKAYIDQKGHLPGLKSAREYGEDGVNMLELNQKLLEKVEEMTLHMVRQQETQHQQTSIIKVQQER
ncbi:MAG: hypothetical protein WD426_14750 [Anditalea sp.]